MAEDKKASGLAYIFGDDLKNAITEMQKDKNAVQEVSLSLIVSNPFQPRFIFDENKLLKLAESIKEEGLRTPLLIRPHGTDLYEVVAGERRYRACKIIGKQTVKAIIGDFSDAQMLELAITDNLQREELSAIEEGMIFRHLLTTLNITQQQLGEKINKSRPYIANAIRLLSFSTNAQEKIIKNNLKMGHVRPLIGLTDKQIQFLLDLIIENHLNSRDIEQAARDIKQGRPVSLMPSIHEQELSAKFNCDAKIRGFKVELNFERQEDLLKFVLEVLGKEV